VTVKGNAEAFLKHLKAKGIPMVLATATEQKYVDVVMERLGLGQYFDVMLSCVDLGVGKDRPDIYLESAKRLGLEVGEICVFEDSYVALETAKAAGFQTVGIFDENNFRQDRLEAASDIYIAKGADIGDLIPMI
jgi:HAD superfamily hydrolase (TIGR01509 family)